MRSRRNSQLRSANIAGIAARITPAETAEVSRMPPSMHSVKRKLPRKLSRNSSRWVRRFSGGSSAGRRSQCAMAMPPMPKRSHASSTTGSTASSGLDSAT